MTLQQEDRAISARVRAVRIEAGLTQQQLARLIDVSYQQAHKYETGITRISAGTLFKIAQALNRPVENFSPNDETVPVLTTCHYAVREICSLSEKMDKDQIKVLLAVAREFANERR